jgi:exopolyphosphatase/guanosine-5'-triphosphate,3'-diphosphate pyrophosphatase
VIGQQPIHLACIDLGSNSFHCQVFAYHGPGQVHSVEIIKMPVGLRCGVDVNGYLSAQVITTALEALVQFADVLAKHQVSQVRAVGTYTLRCIANRSEFLAAAQRVFPYPIDIISGETEARLVFLGATAHAVPDQQHLFIDIGGGSTELIVGNQQGIQFLHSVDMGSAAAQAQYFADGVLSAAAIKSALVAIKTLFTPVIQHLPHFVDALGSGGTMRSLFSVMQAQGVTSTGLSQHFLCQLQKTISAKNAVTTLQLPGLRADRERVLVGGFCVLRSLLELLEIDTIGLADGGVREGMLVELIQQIEGE